MQNHIIHTLLLFMLSLSIQAQHRYIVIDMETKKPERDVRVTWGKNNETRTALDGSFRMDSVKNRITFYKPGYMTRVMTPEELTDTIALLPTYNKLTEVVIYGEDKTPHLSFAPKPMSKSERQLQNGGKGVNVGIMEGIEKLVNYKKRKRQQRTKEILEKY